MKKWSRALQTLTAVTAGSVLAVLTVAPSAGAPSAAPGTVPNADTVAAAAGAHEAAAPSCHDLATGLIAEMTDTEKVGQLFIPWVTGPTDDGPTDVERTRILERGYGAFNFNNGMLHDPEHAAAYADQLQRYAQDTRLGIPVFAATDMEIGAAHRFSRMGPDDGEVTPVPYAMGLGATGDVEDAATAARITGSEARAMGFAMQISPVADVNTNPENPVIGVRAFSEDTDLVSEMLVAQVEASQEQGLVAMPKHFPGHGDTETDSHLGLPVVDYDRQTLEDVHLAPFQAAIDAGTDSIMTAHIIVEAIDPDLPATLSHDVLTGLLRDEMGFDGLIVTDNMSMDAISDEWGSGEAAIMALEAGADLIMDSSDATYDAVLAALGDGSLSEERVDEAVYRILTLKCEYGLFADPFTDPDEVAAVVGSAGHVEEAEAISRRSITLVRDGALPLDGDAEQAIVVTGQVRGGSGDRMPDLAELIDARTAGNVADHGWPLRQEPTADQVADAVTAADEADVVVVGTFSAAASPAWQKELVADLAATGTPVVAVSLGLPYELGELDEVTAGQIATYATDLWGTVSPGVVEAAVEVLFGAEPGGRLPVTLDHAPFGHGLGYTEPEPPVRSPEFHLSNDWRGTTHHFFQYGRAGDEVFIGDWDGDGTDSIAVRREQVFHVANSPRGGEADEVFAYGRPGDVVLVGDWDGDGRDTFAVRRGSEYHVRNSLTAGEADVVIDYGRDRDEVLVGDWNADGTDSFAVRRGSEYHVRNVIAGGEADHVFWYGRADDVVLAGDWDADGADTLGVRRGAEYHVRNSLAGGDADIRVSFGRAGDEVFAGDWDGDGTDTLGVRRGGVERAG